MLGYSKKIILLFLGMFFFPIFVFASELYFKSYSDGSVNSTINIENADFSGSVLYVSVKGKFYLPDGDDITGWQLKDTNGVLVDCQTATTTLSAFGFPSFSDVADYDNQDDMNFVVLSLTGTGCNQTYNNYSGTFLEEIAGWTNDSLRLSFEGPATYTSPISVSDNLSDISFISNETRIAYLDPFGGEIISTSSSNNLYIDYFLAEDDYEPNMFVRLKYVRQQDLQAAVANTDLLWTILNLDDAITSGYHSLSTTTGSFGLDGVYYLTAELRKDPAWYTTAFSWINPFSSLDPDIVVSSTTTFIYGEMTTFDQFVASTTQNISDYMASSTLDFEQAKNSCWSLSGFDFTDCMNFIFGWQQIPMSNAINNIKDNFFTYAPFGYVKRTYDIMSTTSTSTLPVLSYTFPDDSRFGDMANKEFSFDIWQYFYTDGAPVKDEIKSLGTNKDIWEIFGPITQIIVYLTLLVLIIRDLLDLNLGRHPKDNL